MTCCDRRTDLAENGRAIPEQEKVKSPGPALCLKNEAVPS